MKKLSAMLSAFILALTLFAPPAFATDKLIGVLVTGDYVPAPTSTGPALGYYFPDSYRHMYFRWSDFAYEYDCDLCVQMWTNLESSGYASLEEALAARSQYLGERSVFIFYAAQEDLVYIHVGQEILPGCDTTAVEASLHGEAIDAYYKAVNAFNAMCAAAAEVTGHYVNEINLGVSEEWQIDKSAVSAILPPLHQVFPGSVYIDFRSSGSAEDGSYLRIMKDLDYDATYDKWEHKLDYYYQDTIWITYYADTGDALIDMGGQVTPALSKCDLKTIEKAFLPAEGPNDLSGFQAGIDALTEALQNGGTGTGTVMTVAFAAGGVGVLVLAAFLVRKKQKNNT